MTERIRRVYEVTFNGRPSILQIQQELANAERAMNPYTAVAIQSNGSSDLNLEEITFTMEAVA